MGRYRNYSTEFKRQLAEEWLSGKSTLSELARRHSIERGLIRLWVRKHEAGEFTDELAQYHVIEEYERKIAELERKVGQLTMELELAKRGVRSQASATGGTSCVVSGPGPLASQRGAK